MKNSIYCGLLLFLVVSCQQQKGRVERSNNGETVSKICSNQWQNSSADSLLFAGLPMAIGSAADYLRSQVMEDGKFVYNRNVDEQISVPEDYNVLRHAGTIYAMVQAYELNEGIELKKSILRAAQFLKRETIAKLPDQPSSILAVWSRPELIISQLPASNKLGGAGLGLLALLAVEKIEPGFTSLDTLQGLGQFIQFMQKPDGTYHSKYFPEAKEFDPKFVSLYYPGEAALGLFELYQIDPQEKWLKTGLRFLTYMAQQREDLGAKYRKVDHWALLATQKLFSAFSKELSESNRELLLNHAIQNVRNMVDKLKPSSMNENNYPIGGAGNINMVATNMEGLLAMLPYFSENLSDYFHFCETASNGIGYLMKSQLKNGKCRGGFTKRPDFHPLYTSSSKNAEIRIDNVQHSLSALIWMYRRVS